MLTKLTRHNRSGLTLIEVLIAIAILGIGLSGLIASVGKCISVIRKSKDYENARNLLGELEIENPITEESLNYGEEKGEFAGVYKRYTWTRTIEEVKEEDEEESEHRLYLVSTKISWSEHGNESCEEIVTYKYINEGSLDDN